MDPSMWLTKVNGQEKFEVGAAGSIDNIQRDFNPFGRMFNRETAGDEDLSFGAGKRRCIGFKLALMWGSTFLTKMLLR